MSEREDYADPDPPPGPSLVSGVIALAVVFLVFVVMSSGILFAMALMFRD